MPVLTVASDTMDVRDYIRRLHRTYNQGAPPLHPTHVHLAEKEFFTAPTPAHPTVRLIGSEDYILTALAVRAWLPANWVRDSEWPGLQCEPVSSVLDTCPD